MNKNKLNDNQITELYNYLLEQIKNKCDPMSMDEFLVFIEKAYKDIIGVVDQKELFIVIKESIERVVSVLK